MAERKRYRVTFLGLDPAQDVLACETCELEALTSGRAAKSATTYLREAHVLMTQIIRDHQEEPPGRWYLLDLGACLKLILPIPDDIMVVMCQKHPFCAYPHFLELDLWYRGVMQLSQVQYRRVHKSVVAWNMVYPDSPLLLKSVSVSERERHGGTTV